MKEYNIFNHSRNEDLGFDTAPTGNIKKHKDKIEKDLIEF